MTEPWTDDPQVQAAPDLEVFLRDLAVHADRAVGPAARTATLEAMLATATTATTAPAPAPTRSTRASRTRRARRVLGLTGVKLALAAGVATATTTGGLAATGTLPDPVQAVAHDLGRRVGIGVPAAPGHRARSDGDADTTGRDHAPGQRKQSDEDPTTTGRDHAPGQQRGQDAPVGAGGASRGQDAPSPADPPPAAADDTVWRDRATGFDDATPHRDTGRHDDAAPHHDAGRHDGTAHRDDAGPPGRGQPGRAPRADAEEAGRPGPAPAGGTGSARDTPADDGGAAARGR